MSLFKIKSLVWVSFFLAGLWLAACKTMPTSGPSAPPQPETRPAQETPQPKPVPPSESAPPEAKEKSKTGSTDSPETIDTRPESKEAPQDRSSAAAGKAEARPQEAEQRSAQGSQTSPQTADAKLAKAREDLRISRATEKRIVSEIEALKKSGNASGEEIRNYEAYLDRVQAMVAENRIMVEKMEAAYAGHSSEKEDSGAPPKVPDQQIPEEQVQDQVAQLDRQLSASLSEFDAMLLKEMETIETESNAKMRDLAQEAADAARRLREKGVEIGGAESESAEARSESDGEDQQDKAGGKDKDTSEEGKKEETQTGEGDDTVATADSSKGEGTGPTGDRGSRYSKEDDDIVARQLREAAENETDPELKEKLWKEYEEYKKNTQQ